MKLVFVICLVLPLSVVAQDDPWDYVYSVDNAKRMVIITDKLYLMPFDLKVSIISKVTKKSRPSNRYALKSGQKVFIRSYVKNRQAYVSELIIVE